MANAGARPFQVGDRVKYIKNNALRNVLGVVKEVRAAGHVYWIADDPANRPNLNSGRSSWWLSFSKELTLISDSAPAENNTLTCCNVPMEYVNSAYKCPECWKVSY
jgi:hypothetical protein